MTWRWKPGHAISRRLLKTLRLEIRCNHTAYMATCELTPTGETIGTVARRSAYYPAPDTRPPSGRHDCWDRVARTLAPAAR